MTRTPASASSLDGKNDPAVEAAFDAASADVVAEILDGELYTMPRPRPRHARAATRLGRLLGGFDGDRSGPSTPGGWVLLDEPEIHLGPMPDKLVPDLAGWRRDRFPARELDASDDAAIAVAPDWVCEVLSERTEAIDRGKKRRIYRREGVEYLWYVDPRDRSLEVWQLHEGRWLEVETFEGDRVVAAPPFEQLELDLAALWRW
ncbi:MAG: Uma2 family endonuclease [Labilithrix sp.]|nr:Uma2 family endonuclease [Labilithrix sp.]